MRKVIILTMSLVALLSGCGSMMSKGTSIMGFKVPYKQYREVLTREYVVGENPHITVRNPRGDVGITAWKQNKVKLTATKMVRAITTRSAKKYGRQIKIETELKGDSLRISTIPYLWEVPAWREINYALLVPATTSLDIKTSYGEVTVRGSAVPSVDEANRHSVATQTSQASIRIRNSHGQIIVRNIAAADLHITNNHGDITLSNIQGKSAVRSSHAKVKVSKVLGDVDLRTHWKPILVENVKGNVTVSNSHASVRVRSVEGDLNVTNRCADVVADSVTGGISISNSHGDIVVKVFGTIQKEYRLRAEHGDITLQLSEE